MTSTIQNEENRGAGLTSSAALEAFRGDIEPSELSLLYKAGVGCVAFAMILLPGIYLGVIGVAAYGVFWHLTQNAYFLHGGAGFARLVAYFGPAFIGVTLVVFMVKPFFAKASTDREPITLDPVKERVLFAFIQKICELVKAPMPCRVDVDCQVNASASLRRGLLSNDLVLTIGLPLAAGLDMRQFAGVLAHEFGHFAQGAGMRLTYIVRSVNYWFARVVYERDEWDFKLEAAARGMDIRIGIILHLARFCIWLTRRLLWALMHVGHTISCFMLRQMEYDADSYEAKIAGSDAFEATSDQMRRLHAGVQLAMEDLRQDWTTQRLPESVPVLVQHKASTLPKQIIENLYKGQSEAKTKLFDTHPCDKDRTLAARALNEPGIFRLEQPASALFADFNTVSKAATLHLYKKEMKLVVNEENLISAQQVLEESVANVQADDAFRDIYGKVDATLKPLLTSELLLPPLPDPAATRAKWQKARTSCEEHKTSAEKVSEQTHLLQDELAKFSVAHHLLRAKFKLNTEFGLPKGATTLLEQDSHVTAELARISTELGKDSPELEAFVQATRTRILSALELLQSPELPLENRRALLEETRVLLPVFGCVGGLLPQLREMVQHRDGFLTLLRNRQHHAQPAAVDEQIKLVASQLRTGLEKLQTDLKEYTYPFSHARGKLSLKDYARDGKKCYHEYETLHLESNSHIDRLFSFHYRVLGRLLVIASAVEKALSPEDALVKEAQPTA